MEIGVNKNNNKPQKNFMIVISYTFSTIFITIFVSYMF